MDRQEFYSGRSMDAWKYMGAHRENSGVRFVTYAPGASRVALIGTFNDWNETEMFRTDGAGFYEAYVDNAQVGDMYKYRIYGAGGRVMDHADPYGFGMEKRPASASLIRDLSAYTFHDAAWMAARTDCQDAPLNIYEMHMGSWKKPGEAADDWYTYREIGEKLVPYLKAYGFSHVELMPILEHPFDGSWGYQNTGFFAPTSRYGTATDLKAMVDHLHANGIGVILDYVPVHFAVDDYGLKLYDGTALYEYPAAEVGESEWGSLNFIHSRPEVGSFLLSCADYWLSEYHFDGLRMDAVSRLIYWQGDENRGVNGGAIAFLKTMNGRLKEKYPSVMLIAEDSTSYSGTTRPVGAGGLGFDYKWDMGWMHDTLSVFQTAPENRRDVYHKLTFSMMYYYNEQHLLPLSHDENVHGKATILQKMHGGYEEKFQEGKVLYLYMMMHPGKKLLFMGSEFGQFREWDEKREQDFDLLKYETHRDFSEFMKRLGNIYLTCDALWHDYDRDNFFWEDCHKEEDCVYVIRRRGTKEDLVMFMNLGEKSVTYTLPIPGEEGRCLISTEKEYKKSPVAEEITAELKPQSAQLYKLKRS